MCSGYTAGHANILPVRHIRKSGADGCGSKRDQSQNRKPVLAPCMIVSKRPVHRKWLVRLSTPSLSLGNSSSIQSGTPQLLLVQRLCIRVDRPFREPSRRVC